MARHTVRNSIRSFADLAAQTPHLYRMVTHLGEERRRQRHARAARQAGMLGAGLVLGAGLTGLLTPNTGAQLRRRISDQAKSLRDYVVPRSDGAARPSRAKREQS